MFVRAVAVDDHDSLESGVSDALANVEAVFDEMLVGDVYGAGKVLAMLVVAVWNIGHDEKVPWVAARSFERNLGRQQIVGV